MMLVWSWLKANWKWLGWPVAVVLVLLLVPAMRSASQCQALLAAERSKPPVERIITQTQAASTSGGLRVKVTPPAPSPIPDGGVRLEASPCASVEVEAWGQTQASNEQKQEEKGVQVAQQVQATGESLGVLLGAGYREKAFAEVGLRYGRIEARYSFDLGLNHGGSLSYEVFRFGP